MGRKSKSRNKSISTRKGKGKPAAPARKSKLAKPLKFRKKLLKKSRKPEVEVGFKKYSKRTSGVKQEVEFYIDKSLWVGESGYRESVTNEIVSLVSTEEVETVTKYERVTVWRDKRGRFARKGRGHKTTYKVAVGTQRVTRPSRMAAFYERHRKGGAALFFQFIIDGDIKINGGWVTDVVMSHRQRSIQSTTTPPFEDALRQALDTGYTDTDTDTGTKYHQEGLIDLIFNRSSVLGFNLYWLELRVFGL